MIVLHHHADLRAEHPRSDGGQRQSIHQHFAGCWRDQSHQDLQQCGLPTPDGPEIATCSTGRDAKIEVLEYEGLALGITERQFLHFNLTTQCTLVARRLVQPGLLLAQRDIGETIEMQPQHPQFDRLFQQTHGFLGELGFIRNESEQHSHSHMSVQRRLRAEIDHQDIFKPE